MFTMDPYKAGRDGRFELVPDAIQLQQSTAKEAMIYD